MSAIPSLKTVPGLLRSQPILFVPAVVLTLAMILPTAIMSQSVLAGLVLTALLAFVMPLFIAGTVGMAHEAASSTKTSLSSFVRYGKQYYLSVFGAYLLFTAIVSTLQMGGGFLGGIIAVTTESLGVLAVGALVFVVAYLAVTLLLQFFAVAIVVEDQRAVGGLRRSASVVASNIGSAVGYSILLGVIYLAVTVVVVGSVLLGNAVVATTLSTPLVVALVFLVASPVSAIHFVYMVVFYRSLVASEDLSTTPGASSSAPVGDSTA